MILDASAISSSVRSSISRREESVCAALAACVDVEPLVLVGTGVSLSFFGVFPSRVFFLPMVLLPTPFWVVEASWEAGLRDSAGSLGERSCSLGEQTSRFLFAE